MPTKPTVAERMSPAALAAIKSAPAMTVMVWRPTDNATANTIPPLAWAINNGPRRGTWRYPASHRWRWMAAVATISAAPAITARVDTARVHADVVPGGLRYHSTVAHLG